VRAADLPELLGAKLQPVYKVVYNKFYIDEFYQATVVWLAVDGSRWLWHAFDEKVIDGAVHGMAWLWQAAGRGVRPLQTGRVQELPAWHIHRVFVIVTVVVFL